MNTFLNGFMISGGLIMAIGAQNAFVLKQGLLRQHIGTVVLLCWLCDVILIGAGVYGVGAVLSGNPLLSALLSLAGGLFLLSYGAMSAKRAWTGGNYLSVDSAPATPSSRLKTAAATLAITLLNPHVYVDTVMLIGGYATGLDTHGKTLFLIGALTASALWFCSIGFGSRLLLPVFRRERVWQVLDALIALMMFYLAAGLLSQAWTAFRAV